MKKFLLTLAICGIAGMATVLAQGPGGQGGLPDGKGRGGPGGQGEGRRPPPGPIIGALDADHDYLISAEEIQNAVAALKSLDANSDGQLSEDEFHPGPPPGGPGGGPPNFGSDEGPRGSEQNGRRPDSAEGRQGPRGQGGPDNQRGPSGPAGRGRDGGPNEDGPPPPPNPEQFVEHAMEFDADGDGKLSRDELMKFAEEMPPPPPGAGGPDGPGGPGGRGGRPDEPPRDGDRPSRPRRPE